MSHKTVLTANPEANARPAMMWGAVWRRLATLLTLPALAFAPQLHAFDAVVPLSSLTGASGFRLDGGNADYNSGQYVSNAGDINGDGIDDLVVGAGLQSGPGGAVYVVYGKTTAFSMPTDFASLDGTNGFSITSADTTEIIGYTVTAAGDLNNDGIDDLAFSGAALADDYRGAVWVLFGSAAGFDATVDVSSLDGGVAGFRVIGANDFDFIGFAISGGLDLNGDNIDDLVIGRDDLYGFENEDPAGVGTGAVYVVYGHAGDFTESPISLGALAPDGSQGFSINGEIDGDLFSSSVSKAGDINGDGRDDLVIGAPYSAGAVGPGRAYVVFGRAADFPLVQDVADLLVSGDAFRLNGGPNEAVGVAVSNAGDVNDDTHDDLIVGAPGGANGNGAAHVVFGRPSGTPFAASIDLSSLNGSDGFRLTGTALYDYVGYSVSNAGDVNGDGLDDVVIGAPTDPTDQSISGLGNSYVVFGRPDGTPFQPSIALGGLDGTTGFRLAGETADDYAGHRVSYAGDINADGSADLVIGVPNSATESAYVVFGETITPCGPHVTLVANEWKMVGISCDLGANNTVEDAFGVSLPPAGYLTKWVAWTRDEETDSYRQLTLSDTLATGDAVWLYSIDNVYLKINSASATATVYNNPDPVECGVPTGCYSMELVLPDPLGLCPVATLFNMVGHPVNEAVEWASVRFSVTVDGAVVDENSPYSPSEADVLELVSKTFNKYNGNGYDAYDDVTPGMLGELFPTDAIWVEAGCALGPPFDLRMSVPFGSEIITPPPPPP